MMQQMLLSYGGAAVDKNYWSLELRPYTHDALTAAASNGPRVDSSGNVYSSFYFDDSSGNSEILAGLVKTDSEGVVQWVRGYTPRTDRTDMAVQNYGFDVSSSGTILHAIAQGYNQIEYQLLATDGTTTSYIKRIGAQSGDRVLPIYGVRIGASGGHYLTGQDYDNINSSSKLGIFKLDSGGGISWARYIDGSNDVTAGRQFGIDSSENTYHGMAYYLYPMAGNGYRTASTIAKYNSSGTIQWKNEFKIGSSQLAWDLIQIKGVESDSSGNSYAFGRYVQGQFFSSSRGIIIKLNSSGTLQWIKQVPRDSSGYGGELQLGGSLDSSGNLYVSTYGRYNSDRTGIVVHKFNSSGVAQYSRILYYNASATDLLWGFCSVDSNDNLYVTAYATVSSVNRVILLKVPSDGTGTDDYGNLTWATQTTTTISDIDSGSGYSLNVSNLSAGNLNQVNATISIDQTNISSPSVKILSYS